MALAASPPLVFGFGNVLLGDGGAGVRLVERPRSEFDTEAAELMDGDPLSLRLLPYDESTDSMRVARPLFKIPASRCVKAASARLPACS